MSQRAKLPAGARLLKRFEGIIPSGTYKGKEFSVELWSDYCSQGYKSKYERIQTHFLRCCCQGQKDHLWRFSGSNLPRAEELWADNVRAMKEEIAKVEKESGPLVAFARQ